ncbi:MAG: outer membrane lipoprotein chaperone LolA [Hylemonella sp.]|uniref:outer membrane lipoprotein chaperone LolA n=1 Tax=Hylemonella sp. TaxID=2066020 RepID=UPI0022CAD461|nr:outer membrane lipoprotein chaperone LolA [Hylemonella sp.]MCZ8251128.1 outer membrane lipoprotein chaperone LolA [Hylemonella sp.]
MKKLFALCFVAFGATAQADGLGALELFLKTAASGRAEFSQVVTSPPREGQTARTRNSSGTFEFQRPGRFRFVYGKPLPQTIVADGQTLWLYDVDLNQVTARAQASALGSTPAALIAAAPDLQALQADYQLANAPERDGLQWVQATPRTRDGQVQSVRVGLREVEQGGRKTAELAALEIVDSFGQRSLLTFNKVQLNVSLPPETFRFKPPAGADVIRQ